MVQPGAGRGGGPRGYLATCFTEKGPASEGEAGPIASQLARCYYLTQNPFFCTMSAIIRICSWLSVLN
jgi:hypothetical protein